MSPHPMADKLCPCNPCCKYKNHESTAWAVDGSARASVVISGIFLGSALLRLAMMEAGCDVDTVDDPLTEEVEEPAECLGKVYGMKPSSLLAVMGTLTGILAALTMPLVGAVVDHTKHRWTVGVFSAAALIVINFIQFFLGESTWFMVAILQVLAGYLYLVHCVVQYAYLPELTDDPVELSDIAAKTNMYQFLTQVVFLVLVIVISGAAGLETIQTARMSQLFVVFYGGIMFWIPWAYLFQKRPALHQVPQNSNLAVLGFQRLGKTIVALRTDYKPVTTFLLAVSFTEAAVNAFTTIAITYATVVLEMTGSESGGMIGICLVFAVPGSIIFGKVTKRIGVYKSYLASLLYWAFVTTIAPFFMSSPKHKANAYLFGILWGIGFGWVYPTQRTAYCLIIPAGQESELMGIYIFAGQVIVWLPPLIFAVLNENHISMKWGLVSDAAFFVIGFLICYSIGDFAAAEDKAKETAHKRVMPPVARRNSAIELNDNPEYQEEVGGNGDNQL